ncbi:Dihydroneopterin aldolase 1 [Forsythia ovata]|uniref:7,8-dihydroneopterin aldolase n=1 Tax=Forsythia ovata TaxID=205694 RepID=A0ABD1VJP2_9LAMI
MFEWTGDEYAMFSEHFNGIFSGYMAILSFVYQTTTIHASVVTDHRETLNGDKLVLRGLKFHGYHGVKPEEKKLGQKFLIDVDAWMDLQVAGNSDNLSDTISYTAIYRIVKEVVEGASHNLLESVAQLIASTILSKYHQLSAVRVQVGKPHVAVQGSLDYLGVEITRYRSSVDMQS